jgi:Na+-transporting NADH:ubiquinone oxidoreductase subunit NqrB
MQINGWTFWGIMVFTSAGTAALDLIFPPGDPVIATGIWVFFTFVGVTMMLYGWRRK